jgi:uroporphyrin-3 C-methyltransferase
MEDQKEIITNPAAKISHFTWVNLGFTCCALSFVVLLLGFYGSYFHLIKATNRFASAISELDFKYAQTQADLTTLQSSLQEIQQQSQATAAKQQDAVQESSKVIPTTEVWKVAEAQYLTKLADINLQLAANIHLATKLLQTADEHLQEVGTEKITPMRKALAADILSLQNVEQPDVVGIYAKLAALNNEIDKLALYTSTTSDQKEEVTTDTTEGDKPWWKRGWKTSMQTLNKIIIVHYHAPGKAPFIAPDSRAFVFLNLHAMLEQAMSALMQKQTPIYQDSLTQAQKWVEQYFVTEDMHTRNILSNLAALQAVTIKVDAPSIKTSLAAFQDYYAEQKAVSVSTSHQ